MNKERELLVHALDRLKNINYEDDHLTNDLIQTIQELLMVLSLLKKNTVLE